MPDARARAAIPWRGIAVALVALLAGCLGSSEAGAGEGDGDGETSHASLQDRPCPEDSFLTWENFGEPFMRDWCTGCHSSDLPEERRQMAPLEVDFDDLAGVRDRLERVWTRAADQNRTMPPAGGPGSAERQLLGEWLACGAPSRTEL